MNAFDHRPVLIIIAGPNGSGKTTITSQILHHEWMENSVYINPDQVAQERFGDWNSAEAVRQAAEYCADWRERCLADKQSMIFETVFSGGFLVKHYTANIPQWAQLLLDNNIKD